MRARGLVICLVVVASACTSASPTTATSPTGATSRPATPSLDPNSLEKGQIFLVGDQGEAARFTAFEDARNSAVTIRVVAYHHTPAFNPAVIEASPGQTLSVTVAQNDDLSANFQHNFSVDSLGIDKDIPEGADGITVNVTVPASGQLVYYCKYHLDERHAGTFLVQG
jgi:plastocyanin